jgi:hypothetical protein
MIFLTKLFKTKTTTITKKKHKKLSWILQAIHVTRNDNFTQIR